MRLSLDTRAGVWTVRICTLALLLGAWQIYADGISRALFAPPTEIAESFVEIAINDDALLDAAVVSMGSMLVGFALAIGVGVAVGVAMGRFRILEHALDPYVSFLYAVPSIALIPLLVIWFGIDATLRVVLVFLAAVFPIIVNTMAGVKQVDGELIDVARVNCASERQIMRSVILPAALPFVFAGIQVALAQALVGVIVAEMTAVVTGLGGLIIHYAQFFQTAKLFVPILAVMALSIVLTALLRMLQRRIAPWATVDLREL
jgi:ABC-type nitrate/sulfonate/bicarbonate transport system permease component